MARVVWTQAALRDVARLRRFLAPKNPDAARRAVHTVRQGSRTLASRPEIGRPLDETPAEFREWFIPFGQSGYLTLYHYDGATVTILAVRHGREAGY
jgi:plasmid stabilization system protein ParE